MKSSHWISHFPIRVSILLFPAPHQHPFWMALDSVPFSFEYSQSQVVTCCTNKDKNSRIKGWLNILNKPSGFYVKWLDGRTITQKLAQGYELKRVCMLYAQYVWKNMSNDNYAQSFLTADSFLGILQFQFYFYHHFKLPPPLTLTSIPLCSCQWCPGSDWKPILPLWSSNP